MQYNSNFYSVMRFTQAFIGILTFGLATASCLPYSSDSEESNSSSQTFPGAQLATVLKVERQWQLETRRGKTVAKAGKRATGLIIGGDAVGKYVLAGADLLYGLNENLRQGPRASFDQALQTAKCPTWQPWSGQNPEQKHAWTQAPMTIENPTVIADIGSYAVLSTGGMPVLISSECILAREVAFPGDYVWIGAPIGSDTPPSVTDPASLRYEYTRVLKSTIDFDVKKLRWIVMARHAETYANRWDIFQGITDGTTVTEELLQALEKYFPPAEVRQYKAGDWLPFSLTENGLQDAARLAQGLKRRFAHATIAHFFSSPLQRAHQTAEYVVQEWDNAPITELDSLMEASAPAWAGKKNNGQLIGMPPYGNDYADWQANPYYFAPTGGGDTATDLIGRVDASLKALAEATPPGEVSIAVSHNGFIVWLLERYAHTMKGVPDGELMQARGKKSAHWDIGMPNSGWIELYVLGDQVVVPDNGSGEPLFSPMRIAGQVTTSAGMNL